MSSMPSTRKFARSDLQQLFEAIANDFEELPNCASPIVDEDRQVRALKTMLTAAQIVVEEEYLAHVRGIFSEYVEACEVDPDEIDELRDQMDAAA